MQSKIRNSSTTTRRCFTVSRKKGIHLSKQLVGKTNALNPMSSFLSSSPSFYWGAWCQMDWDIPSVIWDQLSWLRPLPASCPSPAWSGMGQFGKGPWCCIIIAQHYLKTWVCRQRCCVTNLKQPCELLGRELTLSPPEAVQISVSGRFLSLIIVLQNNIHTYFVQLGLSLSCVPLFF